MDPLLDVPRPHPSSSASRAIRPLLVAAALVALTITFWAGTRVGGDADRASTAGRTDASPAAFTADLDPAASCQQLLRSYQDRGVEQVTAWGWGGGTDMLYRFDGASAGVDTLGAKTAVRAQVSSRTGTNVQERGVDEPDAVKTDGTRIVRLRGDTLVVHDASGPQIRTLSTLHLPRIAGSELLLDGDTVIVIGADRTSARDEMTGRRRGSRVLTLSLAKPRQPSITSDVTYSARVMAARQHGTVIRLVLSSGLPALDFVHPEGRRVSPEAALVANRRAVTTSTIRDWLPTYDAGDGPHRLTQCADVALPSDDMALDTVSVVGIELSAPDSPAAIGLAGATSLTYASTDRLYLGTSPSSQPCPACRLDRASGAFSGTSHLFELELDGVRARHVASGEIEGSIADRWSLDEAGGVLRVAVGPSSETGSFNSVVTMRRSGSTLEEIGRLDKLGRREQIKGVRWFDDLAIVVTYRRVDPLHSIDLSDPRRPRLLGELKIPGFSDYLHPLDEDRLLGIGVDEHGDAQVALFDTRDLSDVTRTDVVDFPRARALATRDPRAFTWLPGRRTALTVLRRGNGVDLATIVVRGDTLRSSVERVEYGADAAVVRTLELADGRIALVTGEDVRLLDL